MLAGRYTLLEQTALDELLPLCVERGVGVVAAGVFNSGLLAERRPARDANYNYAGAPPRARPAGRAGSRMSASGTARRCPPRRSPSRSHIRRSSASAWAHVPPEQIERNAALYSEAISPDLWRELKADGLLRDEAPVPVAAAP